MAREVKLTVRLSGSYAGQSIIKCAGQLMLAALEYAQTQQSFFHNVFKSTLLVCASFTDGLFASTE